MLINYLKIAGRNLWKYKGVMFINITGLSVGVAAFLLILQYVSFERSYNQFHQKLPTLYRLLTSSTSGGTNDYVATGVGPLAKTELAGITNVCRVATGIGQGIVTTSGPKGYATSFREETVLVVDGSFFAMFSFPILTGQATRLTEPNTVAISDKTARKYFGTQQAVGQVVTLHNQFGKTPYRVIAVYADMPSNSDIRGDMVFSLATLTTLAKQKGSEWANLESLDNAFLQTYVELPTNADKVTLASKLTQLIRQQNPRFAEVSGSYTLQPVGHMHLAASLSDTLPTTGKLSFVYIMAGIAALILLIAWFNYVNLSTVASFQRTKEIGIRKVAGATRGSLAVQFLGESFLLNLLGFGLGFMLALALQYPFAALTGKPLSLRIIWADTLWPFAVLFLIVGALASGAYTALTLARLSVIATLKQAVETTGGWLRQSLVVFQFAVSIALIVVTALLYQQLRYMQHRDLGLTTEQVLVLRGPEIGKDSTFAQRSLAFRDALAGQSFVRHVSLTGSVPGRWYNFMSGGITRQRNPGPDDHKTNYTIAIVDDQYLPTFQIALAAGRNLTPAEATNGFTGNQIMVNETAARALGFASAQAAVGQPIKWNRVFDVVGVVKDYNHQSLQQRIDPVIFVPSYNPSYVALKLSTANIAGNLNGLESLYKQYFPGNPFEFFFADETYNKQYRTEQQYGRIFTAAAGLAIFIACLGLFGLAAFAAQRRTKEIGIRKVLGASVTSIVTLLSQDFLKLVLVAIVIASPVAYYATNRWLESFAYRIDIAWWVFALAGLLAVGIALLTVSFQSVKAALMNPVKSLRSE